VRKDLFRLLVSEVSTIDDWPIVKQTIKAEDHSRRRAASLHGGRERGVGVGW
jgi:hypothetical protein